MKLNDQIKEGIACNSVNKPHSAVARAVCFSVHPGKMVLFPFKHWFNKRYKGKYKFQRLMFSIDLFLLGIIVALSGVALFFLLNPPKSFADNIHFESTVAPREIVTGAPSTLVIRFTNNTEEELRNVNLSFAYPDHFLLQEITANGAEIEDERVSIESIPVGASGTARIRGVMFGNVGGEQVFTSTMNFVHGNEKEVAGQKTSSHTFSPVKSTLSLELNLPERLVAYQPVEGVITYKNTGVVDFPAISIEPKWPKGFDLMTSNTQIAETSFIIPAVKAGKSGTVKFEGVLGDSGDKVTFVFYPSFTFGQSRYRQETLTHSAPILPPQILVSHSGDKKTVQPGSETSFEVSYENIGDFTLSNVEIGVGSKSPFFKNEMYVVTLVDYPELKSLAPGASGTVTVSLPLRSSIFQSETRVYENIELATYATSIYTLGDGSGQRVSSRGKILSIPMTTPLVLDSFARYTTPSGDQIGRGPLPPRVDRETKYWIFWNIGATTNKIKDVSIQGTLPENVTFTGRQTVSQDKSVVFDEKTRVVSWSARSVSPTLSPKSKIVGIAFEVAISPTKEQVGTEPLLIKEVHMTAKDDKTGVFLSSTGKNVSTKLLSDKMATGKSVVK